MSCYSLLFHPYLSYYPLRFFVVFIIIFCVVWGVFFFKIFRGLEVLSVLAMRCYVLKNSVEDL